MRAFRADDLDPGPSTFARLSYQAELRGDLPEATRLMRLSQKEAGTSASCRISGCSVAGSQGLSGLTTSAAARPVTPRKPSVWCT